jgi:hypothetical protein
MDPRHLFVDERLTGSCVFCAGVPDTRDHCPSKVLLDDPLPPNLPVVAACRRCNNSFSEDEQYLACAIDAVLCGSVQQGDMHRSKVKSILDASPALATRIRNSRRFDDSGNAVWEVETERVRNVIVKLARGHVAYELSLPHVEEPDEVAYVPFVSMGEVERAAYESPITSDVQIWPEIGSRAFLRAANWPSELLTGWQVVQEGRYRYFVGQTCGDFVQIVLSEYLACRVVWA